jgi:hypothetical protein
MSLYWLWPFTMLKRLKQFWRWLGNRPDYRRNAIGQLIDPPYTAFWQLRWFPWLMRYLPQPSSSGDRLIGDSIPVYSHRKPTETQVSRIIQRVNLPLGAWLLCGVLLLACKDVPEGRWVFVALAHCLAFSMIWYLNWKDNDLSETQFWSRPHRYIFTGIIRDQFPHPYPQPDASRWPSLPKSHQRRS